MNSKPEISSALNRRDLLKAGVALSATALPLTRAIKTQAAEERKLRTAHIAVGGMGWSDRKSLITHPQLEVVALCDVDSNELAGAAKEHPSAKTFSDYRKLFAEMAGEFDAVVVSTPDHTHAPAAMMALNHGKHVYCQKPLTHDIFEARKLRLLAEKRELTTQMGIQVSSSLEYRGALN
ncbi:MAG: Gfo/Idh/MocA family oxidoreductase [Planctomycetaceae bacterium]